MDFDSYSQLIIDSVSETSYERFMPSLCIAGESVELQVLETVAFGETIQDSLLRSWDPI